LSSAFWPGISPWVGITVVWEQSTDKYILICGKERNKKLKKIAQQEASEIVLITKYY
jgi:hypothetical protein